MTLGHAKKLRTNMTDAERRLWYHLRAHRFGGYKFKRQVPIGRYVVDFACWAEDWWSRLMAGSTQTTSQTSAGTNSYESVALPFFDFGTMTC